MPEEASGVEAYDCARAETALAARLLDVDLMRRFVPKTKRWDQYKLCIEWLDRLHAENPPLVRMIHKRLMSGGEIASVLSFLRNRLRARSGR